MLVHCSGGYYSTCTNSLFENFSVTEILKTGIILPLFKGKGAKVNNKDNYRGIMLFPTLCKIYEMILLNRLEKFVEDNECFSELQFGFHEGAINHMLERGSKVFSCFLDIYKAIATVWIEGLLFKLFSELRINTYDRMWLIIKDLYTNVKAKVLYVGHCPGKLIFCRAQEKDKLLLPLCTKFISKAS